MIEGLVGIIVPVYKVEKYIAECIDSILAQTYTNFRLILVDDGTPDNAGKICDEYAKKDQRITVVHQENAGVTRARARGVEVADDCEFITFVDGDDTILPNAIECITIPMNKNTDIVISKIDDNITFTRTTINIEEYIIAIITGKNCTPWGKLFRKELFTDETFNIQREIVVGEDLIMNLNLSLQTKKNVRTIEKRIYNYRINEMGATKTFRQSLEYEIVFHDKLISVLSQNNNIKYIHAHITRRLITWNNIFGYSYKKPLWFGTSYHKQLICDIKKHGYRISHINYLLIRHKNPIIRFFIINLKKFINIIWKS